MQHPAAAVRPLPGEGDLGAGAVELCAPLDQLLDARRSFLHQNARRLFVAQAIAGLQRVFQVQAHLILVTERSRNATLRILGVGFRHLLFGQTHHAAG